MSNPWLTDRTVAPARTSAEPVVVATGPTTPQHGITPPEHADQLPVREQTVTPGLWVLGVHGGAGESTVAALDESWHDADHAWPITPDGATTQVLLVARSNVRGLTAAQTAARQWASGSVPSVDVVGLAILADAPGKPPRPLRDLAAVVGGGFPRTWHLPWMEAWRLGEPAEAASLPRQVRRLLDDVARLTPSAITTGAHVASS